MRSKDIVKIGSLPFFSVFFILVLCSSFLFSFKNRPSARYKLDFFTSENQFYLCDSAFTGETGDASFGLPQLMPTDWQQRRIKILLELVLKALAT